jgi:hypothetical protein
MESRNTPIFLQQSRQARNENQKKTEDQELENLGNIFLLEKLREEKLENLGNIFLLEKLREEKKRIDDLEELVIKLIMHLETTTNDKILNKVL